MIDSKYNLVFVGFLNTSSEKDAVLFLRKAGVKENTLNEISLGEKPVLFKISQEKLDKTIDIFKSKGVLVKGVPVRDRNSINGKEYERSDSQDQVANLANTRRSQQDDSENDTEDLADGSGSSEKSEEVSALDEIKDNENIDFKSRLISTAKGASKLINEGVSSAKERVNQDDFKNAAEDLRKTAREQSNHYKQRFLGAFGSSIRQGFLSLSVLIKNPIKIPFITITFLLSVIFSTLGILTAILIPVLVMGYMTLIVGVIKNETLSFNKFIEFMRHGWDSLWHIFMLLMSLFVTTAAMIAPLILVVAIGYPVVGTGTIFLQDWSSSSNAKRYMDATSAELDDDLKPLEVHLFAYNYFNNQLGNFYLDSERKKVLIWRDAIGNNLELYRKKADIEEQERLLDLQEEEVKRQEEIVEAQQEEADEQRDRDLELQERNLREREALLEKLEEAYEEWKDDDFIDWYNSNEASKFDNGIQEGDNLFEAISGVIKKFFEILIYVPIAAVLALPVSAALILYFFLAMNVIRLEHKGNRFDLVYEQFGKMIDMGLTYWKEIILSGAFVSFVGAACFALMFFAYVIFGQIGLKALANWVIFIGYPVVGFAFLIFFILYMAMTCLNLDEKYNEHQKS